MAGVLEKQSTADPSAYSQRWFESGLARSPVPGQTV
jgi:hypothetical protein